MTIALSFYIEGKIEKLMDECIQSIQNGTCGTLIQVGHLPKAVMKVKRMTHRNLYRLAVLMRTMDLVHAAQSSPTPVTQRDIYYQDVALFRHQHVSNNAINRLAAVLGCTREELNIVAGSKDLISGELRMQFIGGVEWTCTLRTPSILPSNVHQAIKLQHEIQTVIIVEKEAVFNNIIHQLSLSNQKHMLIVTGKGFPSHSLIHLLSMIDRAKFFLIVDWDPYGLEIAYCYQQRLDREIVHIAARGEQIFRNGWLFSKTLDLNFQDRKKIKSLFQRLPGGHLKKEANYMLHFNAKLELDVIDPEMLSSIVINKVSES